MPTVPLILTPDPYEPEARQVWIDALVVDEPVRLMLDTGAASCTVPNTGHTAELNVVEADTGRGASGKTAGGDIVIVPAISLGPIVVPNVRAARVEDSPDRLHALGVNVLSDSRCHLKFTSGLLEIDEEMPVDIDPLPLTTQPTGQPMVPVQFGSVSAAGCWDTGCSLTAVDAAFVDAHPELFEIGAPLEGTDSVGHTVHGRSARMAGCTIGGVDFPPSQCMILDFSPVNAMADTPMDLGIGMPILALADWVFDFANGVWAVSRTAASMA